MEENDAINEKLRRYLHGELSPEDQAAFELEITQSQSLQEEIALHRQLDAFNEDDNWVLYEGDSRAIKDNIPLFEASDTREFSNKLKQFRSAAATTPRLGGWSRWAVISGVAACLLLVLFLSLPKGSSLEELYVEHSTWEELPSLTVKGDAVKEGEIEQLFLQNNYAEVITAIDNISADKQSPRSALLLYKGVSQLELEQYDKALQTFKDLTESDAIDHHKGYWYAAMVYLKRGDKQVVIERLKVVAANDEYYRNAQAKALLNKLE